MSKLEADLRKVPGIRSARVVGDEQPSEIHIVATSDRTPKQLVRDVQSLAAAEFGLQIDHRIVSVVQLNDEETPAVVVPTDRRPILDRVVMATKGSGGWIKVGLRWPDGEVTEGAGAAGPTRDARARGAMMAVVQALEPKLAPTGGSVEVDHVMIHRLGSSDSVLCRANYFQGGSVEPVVGSALVYDDVATAAVRALLHAINRKLR